MQKQSIRIGQVIISWRQIGLIFLLYLIFFISRSINLDKLPIFADEAIYIRWSQIMKNEPQLRFLPLSDGKQPLFMWLTIPFLKVFSDPLVAGRMVSVFSGVVTLSGVLFLSFLVFENISLALLSGLIYSVAPFAFFFDRLALVDGLLSALGIWSLSLVIILAKNPRLDLSMILGGILGFGLLTKSPALFFVILGSLTILSSLILKKITFKSFLIKGGVIFVSLFIAYSIYNILRLGPNFHMVAIRNKDYVWPITEVLKHPFDPLLPHLKDSFRYYLHYFVATGFVVGLLGLLLKIKEFFSESKLEKKWLFLVLVSWWLLPLLAQSAIGKVFTARYIFYGVPIFVLFMSSGISFLLSSFSKQSKRFFGLCVLLLPMVYFNYRLLFSPEKARLPTDERKGYLQDWTAGQGIKETAQLLVAQQKENPNQHIVIGTEGFFGTLPDGLQLYLEGIPGITAIGVGYPIRSIPESLINARKAGDSVYLLVNKSRFLIENQIDLSLVREYPKPGSDKLLLFRLESNH